MDALKLLVEDGLVVVLHQPVGAYRVPAQRVPLQPDAAARQESGGVHAVLKGRLALLGLVSAPVEGEGTVVEQPKPLFHAVPEEGIALFLVGVGDGVEDPAAEEEVVALLVEVKVRVGDGPPLAVEDAQDGAGFAMFVGHDGCSSLVGLYG